MKTPVSSIISILSLLWLLPHPVAAQTAPPLQAQITIVEPDPNQEELFKVYGTASGQDFSGFRLEFGMGEFPEKWTTLAQSVRSVSNGLLAEWKTAELATGVYALRLTVKGRSGNTLADRMVISLHAFRPDLTVSGVEAKIQDEKVSITGTVINQGKQPVRKPIALDFYLSPRSVLDASAIHLGTLRLSMAEDQKLSSGTTHFLIPPQMKDGSYFLLAKADPKGEVIESDEENNLTVVKGLLQIAPDLMIPELTSRLGKDGNQVLIEGRVKNQGNRPAAKSFNIALFLSSDGSIEDQDLKIATQKIESLAPDSSITFNLAYSFSDRLEPGNYFVLAQADAEKKIFEADESNNVYWGRSLTVGPDLVLSHLSATLSKDGQQIVISDTVKNQGRYPIKQPFKVSYDLAGRTLGSREVPSLAAGEAASATVSFPVGLLPPGTYSVLARADSERAILDMARDNNESRSSEIQIGPDLTMTRLTTVLLPNGEQVEIQDAVRNQGSLPVREPFRVGFYLSPDEQLDPSDRLLGERKVHGLEIGAESSDRMIVPLPPKTEPGRAFVLGKVDPEGVIKEIQAANNTASAGRLIKTDADLLVGQLTTVLASGGDRMVLTDTVKNLGPEGISRPFRVAFYLSRDGVIDAQDLLLGERLVEGLKAGMNSSGTTTAVLTAEAGVGKWSVLARVDSQNQVIERRETNNDYWGGNVDLGPDLILDELKGEIAPDAHEIGVTQVVKNQGNRSVAGGFKGTVYLSRDQKIDSGDILLGSQEVSSLTAGSIQAVRSSLPVPSSVENGKYLLVGRIDSDQRVGEVDEANNDQVGGEILLGPDLVVEGIKSALSPAGESLTVEDTIRNQGNRPVQVNLEVSYFLSKNWAIDDSDIPLGTRAVRPLGAGEASSASTVLQLPKKKVQTGRYFILARVDAGNSVIETDEANNIRPTLSPVVIRLEREKKPQMIPSLP